MDEDCGQWVHDGNVALLTDLYQLAMTQAYWAEGMEGEAVFSLYFRELPEHRNHVLACGLADVLERLETFRFTEDSLDFLRFRSEFSDDFVRWLRDLRFTGTVHAVPEGTPVFPGEPILEVTAPIAEAQVVETLIMNLVHLQAVLASKAARVVEAAEGRPVADFGLRRMHGADAGLRSARAFYVAGVASTSNVLAGQTYGIPVTGTMAHSYIQAHDHEADAFRSYAELYGDTVLLVDTYDTLEGVRQVVRLAEEMGDDFRVRALRLDSGDLADLAKETRRILDEAGLEGVEIFASGGLDEWKLAKLLAAEAPIDGFGVGTRMGVSADAPSLDLAYKLTAYDGVGRLKLSPGKDILPGRKQVWRRDEAGPARGDRITGWDESAQGRPLLRKVMEGGRALPEGREGLERARQRAREELDRLPPRIRALEPADPPFLVEVSETLRQRQREAAGRAVS